MFNDLNSQQNNRQPIDDIFAETDKPNNNSGGNIEAHRVGLTAANTTANVANEGAPLTVSDNETSKPKLPLFKISAIIVVAAILILSGYLVYSKFFKAAPAAVVDTPSANTVNNQATNIAPIVETAPAIVPASEQNVVSPAPVSETSNSTSTPVAASTLDSDSDGLADAEEAIYGTNPSVADTDGDGLTDYDEVKIYHTNPLVADTDGDTYLDGAEVKSGYDPNVKGAKMPGVATSSATVK